MSVNIQNTIIQKSCWSYTVLSRAEPGQKGGGGGQRDTFSPHMRESYQGQLPQSTGTAATRSC